MKDVIRETLFSLIYRACREWKGWTGKRGSFNRVLPARRPIVEDQRLASFNTTAGVRKGKSKRIIEVECLVDHMLILVVIIAVRRRGTGITSMLPRTFIASLALVAAVSLLTSPRANAQLIANESFTGIPTGSGLTGSGSDATGWVDTGWNGGTDARYQVISPIPSLTFQPFGGPLIDGSDRAVQLTTDPEPVPDPGLVATRLFPSQNTTLYASFLVRPTVVGTGSDTLGVQFLQGTTLLGGWVLQPDQGQQFFKLAFITSSTNFQYTISGDLTLYAGQTYLIVLRVRRPLPNQFFLDVWINPPAAYPGSLVVPGIGHSTFTSEVLMDTLGLGISSVDTGGPASTAILDELRIGYTWNDVVPQGPPPPLVPDLQITRAFKLSWQTDPAKIYQVQTSYDLTNWLPFGPVIVGDGNLASVFDGADLDAEKTYRVQIDDVPVMLKALKPARNRPNR